MIDDIQDHLESIYGIQSGYRVRDFLVDGEGASKLGGTGRAREELLVHQSDEGLELALYLEPELVERVSRLGRSRALDEDLGGFCEVAEGVSHFVYLTRTAELERRVSLLELEAQAEVDKFAMCTLLRWGHDVVAWARALIHRLFESFTLRAGLTVEEAFRYAEASRLARRYCERLIPLVRAGQLDRFLAELRHSYRLGAEAKVLHFART